MPTHKTCTKLLAFTFNLKTRDFFKILANNYPNSFNYSIILFLRLRFRYWKHKWNINPNSSFNSCFMKLVNTPIPTFIKLNLLTFEIPTSQPPESIVKLAISPKKIISSILILIPEIHDKKWYVNCLYPFFPFLQWTQWRTFDVLLNVHLSIISVINQRNAQNLLLY